MGMTKDFAREVVANPERWDRHTVLEARVALHPVSTTDSIFRVLGAVFIVLLTGGLALIPILFPQLFDRE